MLRPLRIDVGRSRWLLCYLSAVYVLAITGLMQLGLPLYLTLIGILAVVASALYYGVKASSKRDAVETFELGTGYGYIVVRDGSLWSIELCGQHFVSSKLIVLGYKRQGLATTKHLVLFSDAVDADIFRRLKVMLRFPE